LDSHELPLKENSFEIVISNLMMQWCDIEQITKEASKVLKNDGLFLFSTFGPQTLIELGESWSKVDNNQHISTFMDMHDIGDKMLGLGFKNVVVESEIITLTYEKVMDLLIDLKNIGAQNINSKNISKSNLSQMIKNYEKFRTSGKLPATYEVIYAHGFKNIANI
jgi:malonyl-CoA O-methyltransferase